MGFLKLIGAVSAAEHGRLIEAGEQALRRMTVGRDDWKESSKRWEGRFKNAISDLAAQADEHRLLSAHALKLEAEIAALRPDAEAMRKKRRDDVARVQAKRDAAKGAGK